MGDDEIVAAVLPQDIVVGRAAGRFLGALGNRVNPVRGYAEADQLFIDPVECIDCGACVPVCPVSAIYAADDLPEKWADYQAKNAAHFGR